MTDKRKPIPPDLGVSLGDADAFFRHLDSTDEWNCWVLDTDAPYCLNYSVTECYNYYLPLDELGNSAKTMQWIMHVVEKTWATDAILAGLVRAIGDIFGHWYCGSDHCLTPEQISKRARACIARCQRSGDVHKLNKGQ